MIIYKIANKLDGKIYIGQTVQLLKLRWDQHCYESRKHRKNHVINRAINKYGIENFSIEQIDSASSVEELNEKEINWIKTLNTLAPNGYNVMEGGKNSLLSDETKRKISIAKTGKKIGPRSAETRKKISESHEKNKIKIVCLQTGEIFPSVKEASRQLNLNKSHIFSVLNGSRNHTGGFTFKRV